MYTKTVRTLMIGGVSAVTAALVSLPASASPEPGDVAHHCAEISVSAAADLAPLLPATLPVTDDLRGVLLGDAPPDPGCTPLDPHPPEIPDYRWCEYVFPGELGGIVPWNQVLPSEATDALLGTTPAGTDCSIYDLPV